MFYTKMQLISILCIVRSHFDIFRVIIINKQRGKAFFFEHNTHTDNTHTD